MFHRRYSKSKEKIRILNENEKRTRFFQLIVSFNAVWTINNIDLDRYSGNRDKNSFIIIGLTTDCRGIGSSSSSSSPFSFSSFSFFFELCWKENEDFRGKVKMFDRFLLVWRQKSKKSTFIFSQNQFFDTCKTIFDFSNV